MDSKIKRFLSLLLAFVMVLGMFPTNVFATGSESVSGPTYVVSSDPAEAIEAGRYLLFNTRNGHTLTNELNSGNKFTLSGTTTDVVSEAIWMITPVEGEENTYYVQDAANKYLTFSSGGNGCNVTDTPTKIVIEPNNTEGTVDGFNAVALNPKWSVRCNNIYLNNYGGAGNAQAAGDNDHASDDSGNWWQLYKIDTFVQVSELAVVARYSSNRLVWTVAEGISYDVQYSTDGGATFTTIEGAAGLTSGAYIHENAGTGTEYQYRLALSDGTYSQTVQGAETGLEALMASATAYVDYRAEGGKEFIDGQHNGAVVSFCDDETAEELGGLSSGTIVYKANYGSFEGTGTNKQVAVLGIGANCFVGTHYKNNNGTNLRFRHSVGGGLTGDNGNRIPTLNEDVTAAVLYNSSNSNWITVEDGTTNINMSVSGYSLLGNGDNASNKGRAADAYYVGCTTDGSTAARAFNGTVYYILITPEIMSTAELQAITTVNNVTGVSLDQSALSLDVSDTAALSAALTYEGEGYYNSKATWTTSDEAVATVDAEGNVTAVGDGDATITVTTADRHHTAVCTVHVHNWNESVVDPEPGCETTGTRTYSCSGCSETKEETVQALGHTYDNDCDAQCNVCYEIRTPADHVWGEDSLSCTVCGASNPAIIDTAAELQDALNAGGTVTLGGRISTSSNMVVPEDVTVELNLNGYSISRSSLTWTDCAIENKGVLTIMGEGEISGGSNGTAVINDGELVINGGTYTAYQDALYIQSGSAEINGGSFNGSGNQGAVNANGNSLTITGGTFSSGLENVGEKFIIGGTFTYEPDESYLAEDYKAVDNGNDTWTVKEVHYVARIGEVGYETLESAFNAAKDGDTIVLYENVTSFPSITKAVTFKGGVDGIEVTGSLNERFTAVNGTVKFENLTFSSPIQTQNGGSKPDLTIAFEGCTFNVSADEKYAILAGNSGNNTVDGGLIINNCSFKYVGETFVGGYMLYVQCVKNVTITNNVIDGSSLYRGAIHLGDSTEYATVANVANNTIKNFSRGVQMGNRVAGSVVTIDDNTFENINYNSADSKTAAECAPIFIHANASADCLDVVVTDNKVTNCENPVIYSEDTDKVSEYVSTFTGNTDEGVAVELEGAYVAPNVPKPVAAINGVEYTIFAEALTAAKAMTGDVVVEIYGAVEFVDGMELNSGSYTSISFVGKNADAKITINQTAGGDYLEAHGKTVSFTELTLAKANPAWSGNSGHMGNYFSIQGGEVTYNNCTFPNGACTSGGTAVYNNCTFQNASEYGLWVYDDALVTVEGGTIDSTKGIKVYSEGEDSVTSTLTVKNATFTEKVTAKPAVAIGYAESITLIGNTYNNTTGVLELDSGTDADCEGITFVAQDAEGNDIASTLTAVDRSNNGAACGVLVNDKIYTTVASAAVDAKSGDTVTLLYDSQETVELAEGVVLDKNSYAAENVTVAVPVAKIGDKTFTSVQAAINAAVDGDTIVLLADTDEDVTITQSSTVSLTLDGGSYTYGGTIKIVARAGLNQSNTLTIQNFKFETAETTHDFISSVENNYYPNNVTVQNCSFTGPGADSTVVAVRVKSSQNLVLKDCTGTGLHSFLQNTAGWNVTIDNVDLTNCGSGFAMGTVQGADVRNCDVTTEGFGIRFDAQYNNNAVLTDNTFNAFIPVVVRKASADSTMTFEGTNTMTATNTDALWCVIGTGEYESNGEMPTASTGKVRVVLNDTGLSMKGVYGHYVPTPSGTVNGGMVNMEDGNKTFLTIDSNIAYANKSIVVKIFDANGTLLATTTLLDEARVILGKENWGSLSTFVGINCTDEWWDTKWEEGKLREDFVPAKATLFVDGQEMNTADIQMIVTGTETPVVWGDVPGVPGVPVAEINGTKFETVGDALAYAQAENMTDVTIILLGEVTREKAVALNDSFYLYMKTAFNSVTFRQENASTPYYIAGISTGSRTNGGEFVFDGVNIKVLDQYVFEGNVRLSNNSVIDSDAEANCFIYNGETTIEPGSKLYGVIEDFRGGDLIVDGGKTDGTYNTEPDMQDAIMVIRWSGDKLILKNGAYVKINASDEVGRLTVNTGTSVEMAASKLDVYQWIQVDGTLNLGAGSSVTTKELKGAGKIVIDAADMTAGVVNAINADASGFTGTIEILNNPDLFGVVEDGKIVLKPYVAQIGEQKYGSVQEAFNAAGEDDTVVLLGDVPLSETLVVGENSAVTLDLNGKTITAECDVAIENNGELYINGMGTVNAKTLLSGEGYTEINDGSYNITAVHGGTNDVNIYGGDWNMDVTGFCADNYKCVSDGNGRYIITIKNVAWILFPTGRQRYYESLADAVKAATDEANTIVLMANVELTDTLVIDKNVTISDYDSLTISFGEGAAIHVTGSNELILDKVIVENGVIYADKVEAGAKVNGNIITGIESVPSTLTSNDTGVTLTNPEWQAKVGDTYYLELEDALKAVLAGGTVTLVDDVTISEDWDCRNYKNTAAITIDGNNHTIKFTGKINDAGNYYAAFRFENAATVKNLTIDMSEAVAVFQNRFSAISAKADLTVDHCHFIGSTTYANSRAIIFGEGQATVGAQKVSVTNSEFTNWRYAVVDNMNGKDTASTVTVTGNTFTNASVQICADESVTFTGNTVTGEASFVNITSYAGAENTKLEITATGNTMTANENTWVSNAVDYTNVQDAFQINVPAAVVSGETVTYYNTLAKAIAAAEEGETVIIFSGTVSEGTIKLPANMKNVTIKGEEGAVLKDTTIMTADGSSYSYVGLTFDGITFDNSRLIFTGWRTGETTFKDLTVTYCVFKNLNDTTNSAPVHINMDADEAVNGFTFTNNVIDGATGGSKSGVYAQTTGMTTFTGNTINNVSFRPYVIQITTDDGIADELIVTSNTFSGSAAGRAQALGNNADGTDNVNLVVSENIFKDITTAQQICYWNFNPETTTADLSKNYYDIDILNNPDRIYYNSAAQNADDLIDMGIYPYYADEAKTELVYAPAIMVKYADGTYGYFNEILDAVPNKANYPILEGATITLLADVSGKGLKLMENGIVLDLNGHTYTITEATGSTGTETSGFQIRPEVTTSVTIKNGTIKVAEGAKVVWMFNNYAADFIVEDVTVDCTNMAWEYGEDCYVHVSRAGDNTQFTGTTQITNFNSEVAGDAIYVGGTMTIADTATAGGSVMLDNGATLTAREGMKVVTELVGCEVVYANGIYSVAKCVAMIGDVYYLTVAKALDAAEDGDTIILVNGVAGDESGTEIEFTKDIEFTITGTAPNYALPVITFQNATVTIKDAEILIPELDARQNATINVIDSKVLDAGGNSIVKSYYNGAINISGTSEVYTMQVTTMGYITVSDTAKLHATWQTNVYGNGMITVEDDAIFNTAALHLTGKDYSGRDNTDADRVGKPATIIVDGAAMNVGKVLSSNGADYSYNSGKGINIGTIEDKAAVLDIKNGASVNVFMADGETANIGADGTVNVDDSTFTVSCRKDGGSAKLANNGTIKVSGTSDIAATVTGSGWVYMNGVELDADTKLIGAKVRFASGINTVDGSVIDDGFFQVGIGAYNGVDANVDTVNGVTVNVKNNAKIGSSGATYAGWIGTGFYDTDSEKAAAMTDARYVLNIDNSIAEFGYLHISNDGVLTVNGNAPEKAHYNNSEYSFYAGDFIINGTADFTDTDVLALYTKVSCDNGTDKPGTLNINGTTEYEAERHNGAIAGTNFTLYKTGVTNVAEGAVLYIGEYSSIAADAEMNIAGDVTALGTITNNGTINLTTLTASLTTPEAPVVNSTVKDYKVVYVDGKYVLTPKVYIVEIVGGEKFESLAEALAAAKDGDTINLLWKEGDAPIAMNGFVSGKTVTITGNAQVNWEKGFLFVGRTNDGTAAEDAKLIFSDANLTAVPTSGDHGIHVSGAEAGAASKANGTVEFVNSNVQLTYLINKGNMTLDNSTLSVKSGFAVGGRPGNETESGEDATATITLNNGSKLVVDNHNGMGLGYEAIGVMNVNSGSTFETTQAFLVTAKGTMNVNGGTVKVDGTLTNNGTINVNEGVNTLNITTLAGTELKLNHNAVIKDSTVGGEAKLYGKVTFRGDNSFSMIYDYGNAYSAEYAEWIVEKDASLTLTEKARYGLGYGDKVTIYGSLENALTAREGLTEEDISFFTHGLVAMSNWDVPNSLTVKDAYVVIGSNNSFGNSPKAGHTGSYTIVFENSVLDASRITFYEAGSKTEFAFNSSDVKVGTFMTRDADSVFTLNDTKLLSTTTFNGTDEGNYHAGKLVLNNSSLTYSAPLVMEESGELTLGAGSTLTAPSITGTGKIIIDAANMTAGIVATIDADASGFTGTIEVMNNDSLYAVVENGKIVLKEYVAKIGNTGYATLQEAIDAAQNGDVVTLMVDCDEDVMVVQAPDKVITIDGAEKTMTGSITVDGKSAAYATAGLTIRNVNFVAETDGVCINLGVKGNNNTRYTSNVTVMACTFTGTDETAVAIKNYTGGCKNLTVTGCTATGMHSLMQVKGVNGITVQNVTIDAKSGISVGTSSNVVIEGATIVAQSYGIRADGSGAYDMTVKNSTITAEMPVVVRNNTADGYALTLEGTNTLTASNANQYQVIFTAGDDGVYETPAVSTVLKGIESVNVFPAYQAKIGDTHYVTLAAAIAAAKNGNTVELLTNVELAESLVIDLEGTITIEGNGKTITTASDFNNTQVAALMLGNSNYGDAEAATHVVNLNNVVFDGVKDTSVIRAQGVTLNMDGCTVQNYTAAKRDTVIRLDYTNATLTDSKFENNNGGMVVVHNYNVGDTGSKTKLVIDNCEFTNNTVNLNSAVVYYVEGSGCEITNSEFVDNNVNCPVNAATVYLGFQDNCTVTGNLFKHNEVTCTGTKIRVAGAIFAGYQATITGNAFDGNTASNANGDTLGQVAISTYYDDGMVNLSGNYWNGGAPVYGSDYTIEHQTGSGDYAMDTYFTAYDLNEDGNVELSGEEHLNFVAAVGTRKFTTLAEAVSAAHDQTVILLDDIVMTESIRTSNTVTVDLNGHKLTGPDDGQSNWYAFIVEGGTLTLTDGVGTGELWAKCYGVETKGGAFILDGAKITATNNQTLGSAVVNYGGTVTIKDGTLSGALSAVHTAGYFSNASTEIVSGTFNGLVVMESYDNNYTETVTSASDAYAIEKDYKWVEQDGIYVLTAKDYKVEIVGGEKYETLAEAIAEVKDGETIMLLVDNAENVTITQQENVSFTIDGSGKTFSGKITVDGAKRANGKETLTIQNVNFVTGSAGSIDAKQNTQAHNITVQDCTFTGNPEKAAYAISLRNAHNVKLVNVKGEKLIGLVYGPKAVTGFTAENVEIKDSTYGINLSYGMNLSIKNSTIVTDKIGVFIRNNNASTATFENVTITAEDPVVLVQANTTNAYSLNFNGVNTLTSTADGGKGLTVSGSDAMFKVTVAEGALDMSNTSGLVAQIGNVYYNSLKNAIEDAADGVEIILLQDLNIADLVIDTLDEEYNSYFVVSGKTLTIDLNGKTIGGEYTGESTLTAVFAADTDGKLTLTDSSTEKTGSVALTANDADIYSLVMAYDGLVNIEGGSYSVDKMPVGRGMIYGNVGDHANEDGSNKDRGVNISGGTFTLGNVGDLANGSPWILATAGSNTGKYIFVTGGTFNDDILHQHWIFEVKAPYTRALKDNGDNTWTMVDAVAYVDEQHKSGNWYTNYVGYATLEDAIAAAGKYVNGELGYTVTLLAEAALNQQIVLDQDIILDGTGYKITNGGSMIVPEGVTLGIKGTTTIEGSFSCGGAVELTAVDASLTAVEGKNVVSGVDGYEVVYENGTYKLAVIKQVAQNQQTDIIYETLGEALSAAKSGETVTLLVNTEESLVLVPAGVTLDLSGKVVAAENVLSFGAVIDTAETVGGIQISNDTTEAFVKLQSENEGYLPIYDTRDGMYKFFEYELMNVASKATEDMKVKFGFRILFTNANGYDVLANTNESNVKLSTKIAWTGSSEGLDIMLTFKPEKIAEYGTNATKQLAENGAIKAALTLTLSGLDYLSTGDTVSAKPMISTDAEVGCENDAIVHTVS